MKHKEERTETVKRSHLTETECDLCHRRNQGDGWAKDVYDATETTVECRWGKSYPDGGHGERIDLDICPECFKERLIPWLKEQGVTVEPTEWYW